MILCEYIYLFFIFLESCMAEFNFYLKIILQIKFN